MAPKDKRNSEECGRYHTPGARKTWPKFNQSLCWHWHIGNPASGWILGPLLQATTFHNPFCKLIKLSSVASYGYIYIYIINTLRQVTITYFLREIDRKLKEGSNSSCLSRWCRSPFILCELWPSMQTFSEGNVNYVNEIDESLDSFHSFAKYVLPKYFLISKCKSAFPSICMLPHLLHSSATYLKTKPRPLVWSWSSLHPHSLLYPSWEGLHSCYLSPRILTQKSRPWQHLSATGCVRAGTSSWSCLTEHQLLLRSLSGSSKSQAVPEGKARQELRVIMEAAGQAPCQQCPSLQDKLVFNGSNSLHQVLAKIRKAGSPPSQSGNILIFQIKNIPLYLPTLNNVTY